MKTKYLLLFLVLFIFNITTGLCTQHTVSASSSDFVFSPAAINANVGDTIVFALASIHSALEVSQATWNANSNVGNGGFAVPFGGGSTVVTTAKTYYYVCQNHYFMGMKGTITVTATGINSFSNAAINLEILPNPTSSGSTIKANLPEGKENQIRIFDIAGKCVFTKDNIAPVQYLDMTSFSSGVYFIALKYDDVLLEKKIIISR